MQVIKRVFKTTFMIILITVVYSICNKTELPLLFCVCCALHSRSLLEVSTVSVIMGIVSCAFGKYGFLHGTLLCLYASYIFIIFKPKKRPFLKNLALYFICAVVSLGRDFIYSIIFFAPFYFLASGIYKVKDKNIFS